MMQNVTNLTTQERFFKNKRILIPIILSFCICLLTVVYLALKIKPQTNPIFLHYNIYFGVDLIGSWYRVFIMPALGFIILCINIWISYIMYKRVVIVGYFVQWLTVSFELIILISALLIVRQNI
jgi:hypothetical protein